MERLEHAVRFLAAGYAEIQPLFLFREDGVRIVLAGVSALSAVLLSHCRHHPPPQRTTFGKLHPVIEWHGRVVPRRIVIVFGGRARWRCKIEPVWQQSRRLFRRKRRDTVFERKQPREQTIQPDALLGREWRALRDQRREGRAGRQAHSTAS